MRIAICEVDEEERKFFEQKLAGHQLIFFNRPIEHSDLHALTHTDILCTFIYTQVTSDIINNLPCLKLIVTRSTGYDHIDIKACKKLNIPVCNVPKYGGIAVAEHTLALMLALIRKIPQAHERTSHDDFSIEGLKGFELAGKTLGVIGAGTIGSHIIDIAFVMGMRILVHERTPNKELEKKGAINVSLNVLLQKSDIITLHVPLTPETYHMIDSKAIKMMKKGAYIINTARGDLIDTVALANALDNKHIAGAALDVLEGEGELRDPHQPTKEHHIHTHNWRVLRASHQMLKRPNVIVTPHIAFYTEESVNRIRDVTIDNIAYFADGHAINLI